MKTILLALLSGFCAAGSALLVHLHLYIIHDAVQDRATLAAFVALLVVVAALSSAVIWGSIFMEAFR